MVGFPGTAPHYQLIVERQGVLDTLSVQVEAAPDLAAEGYSKVAADVRHHIKSMIGVTCGVSVLPPGDVPRSQGKAVRVRDLRRAPDRQGPGSRGAPVSNAP